MSSRVNPQNFFHKYTVLNQAGVFESNLSQTKNLIPIQLMITTNRLLETRHGASLLLHYSLSVFGFSLGRSVAGG
jgi:hypothetical protein